MRALLAATGLLVLLAAPAKADWQYARWGMSPEEVAKASAGAVKVLPDDKRILIAETNLEYAAHGTYEKGPLLLDVTFSFDAEAGGLACIAYGVRHADQNALIEQALVEWYGPPEREGGLPATGMRTVSWTKPDPITLTLMPDEGAWAVHCSK